MKFLRSLLITAALTAAFSANAQYFDHLSAGLTLGTDGIGIELASPIGNFVEMRAGYSFTPGISYKTDVDIESKSVDKAKVKAKLNMGDAKVLFDFFPIKGNGFHLTAGAYIGKSEVVTLRNAEYPGPITGLDPEDYGTAGIVIGDYLVTTDENGAAKAAIKTNSFKPYLGLGFGRGCSDKLVSVQCNLGVEFWGKPGVYAWDPHENKYIKASEGDFDNEDAAKALRTISKIGVWPVLNIRVAFRAF